LSKDLLVRDLHVFLRHMKIRDQVGYA